MRECNLDPRRLEIAGKRTGNKESNLQNANVLVTGGAGFIGSHLVDALVERGHRVRVLDALVSQVHGENVAPAYLNPDAEFIQGDVCDRAVVDKALDGIDVVFHEAAEVGVGQSMYEIERYVRANDLGTAVLLEAILERRPQIKKSRHNFDPRHSFSNVAGKWSVPSVESIYHLPQQVKKNLCI